MTHAERLMWMKPGDTFIVDTAELQRSVLNAARKGGVKVRTVKIDGGGFLITKLHKRAVMAKGRRRKS